MIWLKLYEEILKIYQIIERQILSIHYPCRQDNRVKPAKGGLPLTG